MIAQWVRFPDNLVNRFTLFSERQARFEEGGRGFWNPRTLPIDLPVDLI